jgi:BirA family biotin operon repressor/biotin-[acetyl-CoA-carboxylase] ligase
VGALGRPRLHVRSIGSTNDRLRELVAAGAPHGTLVTAGEQTAGRGRQGRGWSTPAGEALAMSLLVREPPPLLSLVAAVAVVDAIGDEAEIKWPNDVLVGGRKVAGILVEARGGGHGLDWAIVGIGVNVAVSSLPEGLRETAASLQRSPADVEPFLAALLAALERRLASADAELLDAWRARDALRGRRVEWNGGEGTAAGIDDAGRLLVKLDAGGTAALDAGEVHLRRS